VLNLCSMEVRVSFYCILEKQMKNKLMDETKYLAYFIRQNLNILPKFVISIIPLVLTKFDFNIYTFCRSQWPCSLRRRSASTFLLRLWFRIPPATCMSVCCQCCVLSGTGLCDELTTRPEEFYRLWCVDVCDPESS
jgi:hypothetical protein